MACTTDIRISRGIVPATEVDPPRARTEVPRRGNEDAMGNESLSIVIPVYNSESTLAGLLERLHPVLAASGRPFEIILVNDGSADGSQAVLEELARRWGNVRPVQLIR